MPAGQSILGIYNIAAAELGQDPLTAPDQNIKLARWCNVRYAAVRQSVIRKSNWGCCKALAKLAADPIAPPFNWGARYPLPADYIRVYGVMDVDGNTLDDTEWEVVGPWLMTDQTASLPLQYFFDLVDVTRMDACMTNVIGYELAIAIQFAITRDSANSVRIGKKRDDELAAARFSGAIEDSPKEWDVDVLLRARRM